ncbi:MAG: bifunctional histidinol-phosphatase/imidazoleglycerol-phosphate dehydratase HisB [Steroidobacteraceae bacterium]
MSGQTRVLFVDRDGTLVEEPPDEQVDSFEKIRFLPGVFGALQTIVAAGWRLVMVTNQDGLGTASLPLAQFQPVHEFILRSFASQGIEFDAVYICPHFASDHCNCRKPDIGMVTAYLEANQIDMRRSAVVGDRESDMEFARRLGIRGLPIDAKGSSGDRWPEIANRCIARIAQLQRRTRETSIDVLINLDDPFDPAIHSGIGFFDHMLEQLTKHAGIGMVLNCVGDLHIDDHHTVEDCALALGQALREAMGDKRGIDRYGFVLPMDEALATVSLDLSGRAHCEFDARFGRANVGGLSTELVSHFFRSLADAGQFALHIKVAGSNTHHMIEACFKGVGRSLRMALRRAGNELPSTKGVL